LRGSGALDGALGGGDGVTREAVVYVHGLWSSRADSLLLRRRIAHALGCEVWLFSYASVSSSMEEVTERLRRFVAERVACAAGDPPARLHWVGHSLGGLVIYRFFERFPVELPGRVVFLGTPAVSCRAAQGLARLTWMAPFVGRCVREELLVQRERRWMSPHELGIIAGTRRLGLGHLVARFDDDNDGTIAVSETRLPGAADFISVPASHMGLLVSAIVARQTAGFLRDGHFSPSPRLSAPPFSNARNL